MASEDIRRYFFREREKAAYFEEEEQAEGEDQTSDDDFYSPPSKKTAINNDRGKSKKSKETATEVPPKMTSFKLPSFLFASAAEPKVINDADDSIEEISDEEQKKKRRSFQNKINSYFAKVSSSSSVPLKRPEVCLRFAFFF
jgi:hypothetical protein